MHDERTEWETCRLDVIDKTVYILTAKKISGETTYIFARDPQPNHFGKIRHTNQNFCLLSKIKFDLILFCVVSKIFFFFFLRNESKCVSLKYNPNYFILSDYIRFY